ncbi:MAG: DUF3488 domain-containing protein [Polyangiaceae bacterium]|nr:DUF3488 domain-containing protein [Polyangiaceae bacterium]
MSTAIRLRAVGVAVFLTGIAMAYPAPEVSRVFCALIGAVPLLVGARFEADRVAQAALSTGAMIGGVLIARLTASPIEIATILSERTMLLGLPMLSVASARACLHRPVYGDKLTLLAALVALTAAGRAQTGAVFPVLAALSVLAGLAALRVSDPARAPLSQLGARHYVGMAFGATMAGALALAATWSLPRLHQAVISGILSRSDRSRTGFSESMALGSMDGMLQSDAVVLRIRNGAPKLLRGVVLTAYQQGRWETGPDMPLPEVVETPTEPEGALVEIEHARRAPRYFLPLGATDVASSSGFLDRFADGTAKPSTGAFAKRLWFNEGDPPNSPPPTLADLQVPRRVMPELTAILEEWGASGDDPRKTLALVSEHLARDYRYSLDYRRTPGVDPVIDFLRTNREGHCEYFASAFALLARSSRVPARVVAGYRVMETSPLGYSIVRERNAHSWVEVWIDDHWETFDPTPSSDLAAASPAVTPWIGAIIDGIRTGWEAVDDWFGRRTAFELSLTLVTLVALLVMVRALRGRRGKRQVERVDQPAELERLTRALKGIGIERAPHETLAALAARVKGSERVGEELRAEIVGALARYERHRYGAEGTLPDALAALSRVAARL